MEFACANDYPVILEEEYSNRRMFDLLYDRARAHDIYLMLRLRGLLYYPEFVTHNMASAYLTSDRRAEVIISYDNLHRFDYLNGDIAYAKDIFTKDLYHYTFEKGGFPGTLVDGKFFEDLFEEPARVYDRKIEILTKVPHEERQVFKFFLEEQCNVSLDLVKYIAVKKIMDNNDFDSVEKREGDNSIFYHMPNGMLIG